MRKVSFSGSLIHSASTVGGGAGSLAPAGEQQSPHGFPQRIVGRCTRCRSAALPPDVTARRTLTACNVARYSES